MSKQGKRSFLVHKGYEIDRHRRGTYGEGGVAAVHGSQSGRKPETKGSPSRGLMKGQVERSDKKKSTISRPL